MTDPFNGAFPTKELRQVAIILLRFQAAQAIASGAPNKGAKLNEAADKIAEVV
jgi:hypothetical protein